MERVGHSRAGAAGSRHRVRRRPGLQSVIAKYDQAGVEVRLWDVTTDIGIAAFICDIRDPSAGEPGRLRHFHGAGCHPDRVIALVRALTEAAQSRLTYIAGIRDDLSPSEYEELPAADIFDALLDALRQETEPASFREVPTLAADDLGQELRRELDRLLSAGISRVIAVDLTRADLAIPVVRMVIPGLEGDIRHPHYVPGPRARRATALSR